ncbi:MAG: U32 family peptidase [Clostridia bacterium]
MVELLSPAGNMEKLKTAFRYGADAVYLAGKEFGLRAFAGNFEDDEICKATKFAHKLGKKVFVTLNILARDSQFSALKKHLHILEKAKVDAVIISDLGVLAFVKENAPSLEIHTSTQASVVNSASANLWAKLGAKRIVLARELSLDQIKEIKKNIPKEVELEVFVHGAMCISYSGRCLLSKYLSGRDGNCGECVQACRWEYTITEKSRQGEKLEMQEDKNGTYILNSKDLCLIAHLKELIDIGITSFKIEGRMKSDYYVATVTNAYRRAINNLQKGVNQTSMLEIELEKTSHRNFTTGFMFNSPEKENFKSSQPVQTHQFIAVVQKNAKNGEVLIEQRNHFKIGDTLEVLSPNSTFNKQLLVQNLKTVEGQEIHDAKDVQQKLVLKTTLALKKGDILRKKV